MLVLLSMHARSFWKGIHDAVNHKSQPFTQAHCHFAVVAPLLQARLFLSVCTSLQDLLETCHNYGLWQCVPLPPCCGGNVAVNVHILRVGQNRISAPYMTVRMLISLLKIPYVHRIYL